MNFKQFRQHQAARITFLKIGVAASLVGPAFSFLSLPDTNQSAYFDNLVLLIWPAKILALGTPNLTPTAVAVLVLSNTMIYTLLSALATLPAASKVHISYALSVFAIPVILFQLWLSGFSFGFIHWSAFASALMFYLILPLLARSLVWKPASIAMDA